MHIRTVFQILYKVLIRNT